ncbi:MAG: HAD family hydrolase [Granulosicoccus sp.]
MKFGAVIFDMDGLLINSERLSLQAFQDNCDNFEIGDQLDLFMQLLGTNRATTQSILAQQLDPAIHWQSFLQQWDDRYHTLTSNGVPLMKGVVKLLDYLEERNIPVAVATSTNTDKARIKLEQSRILHRFQTVTGGEQVDNGKPAPDIYELAAQSVGVEPAHCVALEDSANGVRAAVSARMHAIQIPDMAAPDEALLALGHTVLDSLDDVIGYLDILSA